MLWVALLVGVVAFVLVRASGASTPNALLGAIGLVLVLGAIAISLEGWDISVPILILMGAIGGSTASNAAARILHGRPRPGRLT